MRPRFYYYLIFSLALLILSACGPATVPVGDALAGADPFVPLAASDSADNAAPSSGAGLANAPVAGSPVAAGRFPAGTGDRVLTALGDPEAPVVIVEYSDYQCPFCRRHSLETMPQLKAEFIDTGRVYYVFKDFPIATLHPLAYRLHEAALCAGESGGTVAYWQSHDLFFDRVETFQKNSETAVDEVVLNEFAALGLPVGAVQECLTSGRYTADVNSYLAEGQTLGVRGTPSFFINGALMAGAQPYATFAAAIIQAEGGESIAAAPAERPPTAAIVPTPAAIEPRALTALGNPDAPVTIIEFSDYQCPFCRRHFLETMPLLKTNFIDTGRVYYVFKDFPIASLHPLAYRLHEAALCVGEVGGAAEFWQAHDLFFNEAEAFQKDTLPALDGAIDTALATAGLPDVRQCLADGKYAETVQNGVAEGRGLGVNGTPAFFVNGYPVTGAQPYELFEYAITLAEQGRLAEAFRQSGPDDGKARATATAQALQPIDVPLGDAPAKGSPVAPITIVEYSDYQCPFCLRHFQETMPQLQPYIDAGQVRYLFKDFPLDNIHPQAQKAHEAARCAREAGGDDGYWTMHDLLFANQAAWADVPVPGHVAVLKELAARAGLPQESFDTCLDSGRYADAVIDDLTEGVGLGISGTPTFFINGLRIAGAQPFSVFEQTINAITTD